MQKVVLDADESFVERTEQMSVTCEREIREFINTYRQLPELWNTKSPEYSDRNKKNCAYEILVEKYRPICSMANRKIVTKKINSLRTTYRRDMKKLKQCQITGEPFKPTSIFFNELKFLGELDAKPSIPHLIKISEDKRSEKMRDEDSLESFSDRLNTNNDYEALTYSWDAKLRKMDEIQKLLAEGLINKILTKGIFNELGRSTDVVEAKANGYDVSVLCNGSISDLNYCDKKFSQKSKRNADGVSLGDYEIRHKVPKEDEAFFVSVMPSVVAMTDEQKLDFRLEVLRVIKQIKRTARLKSENHSLSTKC